MTLRGLACAIAIGACVLTGCAQSRGPNAGSSETHFLLRCSDDSCGDGLSCICGVCSKRCSSDTSCGELSSEASCVAPVDGSCAEARSCDVECKTNADCAKLSDQHTCAQGRCRAPEPATKPGDSKPSKPDDPGLAYGPCIDNPMCGAGSGISMASSGGECICTVYCEAAGECPKPVTGTSVPKCVFDDVVVNGHSGECELPCDRGETCPDGAACTGGVCRFGGEATGNDASSGGASPGVAVPTSCQLVDVAVTLSSAPLIDCGQLAIDASAQQQAAAVGCVREQLAAAQPFTLFWPLTGDDSEWQEGLIAVKEPSGLVVYRAFHDSIGTGPIGMPPKGPYASWTPCATFSVPDDSCGQLPAHLGDPSCFQCGLQDTLECECRLTGKKADEPSVTCAPVQVVDAGTSSDDAGKSIDPPPCGKASCEFDGVCYPNGATSEDGCCTCDSAGGSCIEPGWCPGWILIGKRCASDADCSRTLGSSSGLTCRTDFFGERGVCTRDCNFGCPTGTECVAEVPDYNGGTVANMCMRTCTTQSECTDEPVGGASLGSSCETHGDLTRRYCF
jgi:hypothetical protein